jgi:hypothetical protein
MTSFDSDREKDNSRGRRDQHASASVALARYLAFHQRESATLPFKSPRCSRRYSVQPARGFRWRSTRCCVDASASALDKIEGPGSACWSYFQALQGCLERMTAPATGGAALGLAHDVKLTGALQIPTTATLEPERRRRCRSRSPACSCERLHRGRHYAVCINRSSFNRGREN